MKKNYSAAVFNTVGSMMSSEPITLSPLMRARDAMARLRKVGVPQDFMTNCYVVDDNGYLLGSFTVRELIMAPDYQRVDQFMDRPKALLHPEDNQKQAVSLMGHLACGELPVVDAQQRLIGTVSANEKEKNPAEEHTYLQTRVWELYKDRVFWLLLLMISAAFTGAIITHYETALAAQVALTAFIPMLMDTGGNCGSQSSVTVIRGLSLGEIRYGDWFKVAWKEMCVGFLCGTTLAVINLLRLVLLNHLEFAVALVVSLTLIVTVMVSKLLGCFLPIAACRLNLDPAVMASPLITTIADAISLVVYFRIATLLLSL